MDNCPCREAHKGETGGYYVSAVDGPSSWLLLGPFDSHPDALSRVNEVRLFAEKHEPRAVFYAFGTVRAKDGYRAPGSANKYLMKAEAR